MDHQSTDVQLKKNKEENQRQNHGYDDQTVGRYASFRRILSRRGPHRFHFSQFKRINGFRLLAHRVHP